jgi:hypothetical protein
MLIPGFLVHVSTCVRLHGVELTTYSELVLVQSGILPSYCFANVTQTKQVSSL